MALNEIKKKISSIQKTAQITKAMKLVSTTKYNRIVTESAKYDEYAHKVREMVSSVVKPEMLYDMQEVNSSNDGDSDHINYHAMMHIRPVKKVGFLVITSDRGLAGNYNSALIKDFQAFIRQFSKDQLEVLAIGRPIAKYCKNQGIHLAYERYHLNDYPTFTEVQNIIRQAISLFQDGSYDELYLVYNYPVNVLVTERRIEKILPIGKDYMEEFHQDKQAGISPQVLVEPDIDSVLDVILPLYAETQIYGAVIDAKTAEQASRMQAMGQATDNADQLISDLQQDYHHERQKRITNEIIEITSGANAQEQDNERRV